MPDLAALHNDAAPATEPTVLDAVVAQDVTDPDEGVTVIIPAFSSQHVEGPAPWIPVARAEGIFYPKRGDRGVVVRPSQGRAWLADWEPQATEPDVVPGGGVASLSLVTTLPASPADGQMCVLDPSGWTITGTAEAVGDVQWMIRYRSSTGKWHCVGGDPLVVKVDASEVRTAAAAYAALATAGPGITVAIAGDYLVQVGSYVATIANFRGDHSYDVGGTGAVDADAASAFIGAAGGGGGSAISVPRRKSLAASATLLSKYKATTNNAAFANRWISILPVRLG